jgi:N-hydroxyarylamine O-acetyltransferase
MQSLDAYLRRIGLGESRPAAADADALRMVHRAHVTSIPFENLDPLRGVPASLEPAALERKLVTERRGGFCFEHNTLLAAALADLGYEVAPMLGRVGFREIDTRGRSHLVLRVRDRDGQVWHADAGFGAGERGGTLPEPIPLGPGGEYEQSGWRYRVESYGSELVLMARSSSGAWSDMYSFVPEPVPAIDVETSNWFSSTHPSARFTRYLVVAVAQGRSRAQLSDADGGLQLRTMTPTEQTVTEVQRAAVPRLLGERFGLPGWQPEDGGRLVPSRAVG